jgi:hypothetical protein
MKSVARKKVLGVITHSLLIIIAAMLNATRIVAMPKFSIVCIQNGQPWMSADAMQGGTQSMHYLKDFY